MTAGGEVFVARTDYFSCFGRLYFFAPDCPAPLSGKQAGITGELLFMFETITTFAFNPHYNEATGFGPSPPTYDVLVLSILPSGPGSRNTQNTH